MTERGAMRSLYAATLLAATVLVVVVKLLEAGDEVLMFGTALIVIVGSLAVGQLTSHYARSNRRRDD
jgi:hypothetical protein